MFLAALIAKTIGHKLKFVLDDVVKVVNFLKSRQKKSRLFSLLCKEMGSSQAPPLGHELRCPEAAT